MKYIDDVPEQPVPERKPSPKEPAGQIQMKLPSKSEHWAISTQGRLAHSLMSARIAVIVQLLIDQWPWNIPLQPLPFLNPSPVKPGRQVHVYTSFITGEHEARTSHKPRGPEHISVPARTQHPHLSGNCPTPLGSPY